MSKFAWLVAGVVAAASAVCAPAFAQVNCRLNTDKIMMQLRRPSADLTLLAAHRGVHALYEENLHRRVPENSIQAISLAAVYCIEMIEVDVRLTKEGTPIISHDYTWGRGTNVGEYYSPKQTFDPWHNTGPNPRVDSWLLADVRSDLVLRTSVDFDWSEWSERPPTLEEVINFMQSNRVKSVLAVDVKDKIALQNAWYWIAKKGFWNQAVMKVDVNMMPNRSAFDSFFGNLHYVDGYNGDNFFAKVIPVFNTSNIQPNNALGAAGGEWKIWDSAGSFNTNETQFPAMEFNIKETNGIMTSVARNGWRTSKAIFNPRREWVDASARPMYFNSDGRCCSHLSAYHYNGSSAGLPSDHNDRRPDWNFVLDENGFDLITTDNVLQIRNELQKRGRRNTSRIED